MTHPRLRLLFLLNSLAPYGAETFVLNHARYADRARFEIVVCQLGGPEDLVSRFREADIETISLRERHRFAPEALARLAMLLRRRNFHIIQTHIGYAGVVGRLVGRAVQVPLIVSTEQAMRSQYSHWLRRANDVTLRLAHINVFITTAVMESFRQADAKFTIESSHVISNGIDVDSIARTAKAARPDIRRSLGLAPGDFAFGNVARLVPDKGQDVLIRAFALLRRHYPRVSLWLVGAGEQEANLRRIAETENVAHAVHFLGQRLDVSSLLGAFDAYVHPARSEALGIAVLEAMAAGLPTIASAVGGIPDFVRVDQTGWLVAPEDVASLLERMEAIVADPTTAHAIARQGSELMAREYDIRGSVRAYESLYASRDLH